MRDILHIDMDAFYASVEQEDGPALKGKPVLVGGSSTKRGVVSAASYEARVFGCRSAMPMARAVQLCPQAVVRPVRMERYLEVSEQVFSILSQFSPLIEPLSIDEAFLDVTGCGRLFGSPRQIAGEIKSRIHEKTRLTASVGVSSNKFLAKLASDLEKPDGLVVVPTDAVEAFLDPLPIGRLWGVGQVTAGHFESLGLRTFKDVRHLSKDQLCRHFGQAGEHFYQFVRGIDDRPVIPHTQAKSLGTETTFPEDIEIKKMDFLRAALLDQIEQVTHRLRRHELLAKTVVLKIRSGDFTTLTRSATLTAPTDQTDILWGATATLLDTWARHRPFAVRLIGVSLSSLCARSGRQMMLFDREQSDRRTQLDHAVDQIRDKFGDRAIYRGLIDPFLKDKK